jgi:large subunit ribosomal protein LP0
MKPFLYGLKVTHVFDGEGMVDPAVLDIDNEDIRACFKQAMGNVAAVGLKIGYPVAPAVPHMFVNAFRNLVALTLETAIDFKQVTFPPFSKFHFHFLKINSYVPVHSIIMFS